MIAVTSLLTLPEVPVIVEALVVLVVDDDEGNDVIVVTDATGSLVFPVGEKGVLVAPVGGPIV